MTAGVAAEGLPAGYVALDPRPPGAAAAVCRADAAAAVRAALAGWGTLYAYAAAHPARRELRGRAPAYAVPLGDALGRALGSALGAGGAGPDVVVRHGWRGGALRRLRRDLFFPPTRAPAELAASERLRAAGVPTPAVVAYAVYRAPAGLRRVDVATELVPNGVDLEAVLAADGAPLDAAAGWVRPTAALLAALARAGARHPDLNIKNVLLAPARPGDVPPGARAWVLDVDVVRLPAPAAAHRVDVEVAVFTANARRFERSLRKWALAHGHGHGPAGGAGDALAALAEHAGEQLGWGRPAPLRAPNGARA